MKTLRFENLIDSRTGETLEVEVPDDFDENDPMFVAAGERGKAFAERINAVVAHNDLRQVHSLAEIGEIGGESARKLLSMFKSHGFGSQDTNFVQEYEELEHVIVIQEWFETEDVKTGWDTFGWTYENGTGLSLQDSKRAVGYTEYDKHGHPIKGYL